MTDFKIGDQVRIVGGDYDGAYGTITDTASNRNGPVADVRIEKYAFTSTWLAKDLVLIHRDKPDSGVKFASGTKVRAKVGGGTIEGVVSATSADGYITVKVPGVQCAVVLMPHTPVEAVIELPTKPYALVRVSASVYIRTSVNLWAYALDTALKLTNEELLKFIEGRDYKVLYEGLDS